MPITQPVGSLKPHRCLLLLHSALHLQVPKLGGSVFNRNSGFHKINVYFSYKTLEVGSLAHVEEVLLREILRDSGSSCLFLHQSLGCCPCPHDYRSTTTGNDLSWFPWDFLVALKLPCPGKTGRVDRTTLFPPQPDVSQFHSGAPQPELASDLTT